MPQRILLLTLRSSHHFANWVRRETSCASWGDIELAAREDTNTTFSLQRTGISLSKVLYAKSRSVSRLI
jgi:hypothetical protein